MPPRKGEQAICQCGGSVGGAQGSLQESIDVRDATLGDPLLNEVQGPGDSLKKIVEVVRYPTCQLAYRFHFLALAKSVLCLHQLLCPLGDAFFESCVEIRQNLRG